jgi:hypothetical protein
MNDLIREFGPIVLIYLTIYKAVPMLVREVMGVLTQGSQARAMVLEGPYMIAKTALESASETNRRMDHLSDTVEALNTEVKTLIVLIQQFMHKEST